mmetsp:Transcript_16357/g.35568  ORF Transcript_16357/g.35568 Transcript_16357/m.35568 type:complete len:226 (-) Transcript_16357:1120-1797(-)
MVRSFFFRCITATIVVITIIVLNTFASIVAFTITITAISISIVTAIPIPISITIATITIIPIVDVSVVTTTLFVSVFPTDNLLVGQVLQQRIGRIQVLALVCPGQAGSKVVDVQPHGFSGFHDARKVFALEKGKVSVVELAGRPHGHGGFQRIPHELDVGIAVAIAAATCFAPLVLGNPCLLVGVLGALQSGVFLSERCRGIQAQNVVVRQERKWCAAAATAGFF